MFDFNSFIEETLIDAKAFREWAGDTNFNSMPNKDIEIMIKYWLSFRKK